MNVLICIITGYLLGSLSSAAFVSVLKKKNLRELGTGNMGATNTLLTFGKWCGLFVMLFDIGKSLLAVKLAQWFFPELAYAGMLAGGSAVAGHIFPFYMKFKGGKGVASLAGLMVALDPLLFILLLVCSVILMFIVNYGVVSIVSVAIIFPIMYGFSNPDFISIMVSIVVSALIIYKHIPNMIKAKNGEDVKVREYFKSRLLR